MIKYIPVLFFLISCSNVKVVESIKFDSSIYSPVLVNNNYLFLSNVQENNSLPCVINMTKGGDIRWIYSIDAYEENIPDTPYYSLINNQGRGVLIYKYKINHIKIMDLITKNNIVTKDIKNRSYLTIVKTDNGSQAIKSGYSYGSSKFRGYTISLYTMDNNLDIQYDGRVELSSYPMDVTYIGDKLFYYDESILYSFNIYDRKLSPSFKFDNDIVKITSKDNFLYVLTTSYLYKFNSIGEVQKSFTLNSYDDDFYATDLIFTKDRVVVKLVNGDNIRLIAINSLKNLIISNRIPDKVVEDKFILDDDKIFYIKDSHLHIRRF